MYIVTEGKALNFGSHKEKLGVNDSKTSTVGSPAWCKLNFMGKLHGIKEISW